MTNDIVTGNAGIFRETIVPDTGAFPSTRKNERVANVVKLLRGNARFKVRFDMVERLGGKLGRKANPFDFFGGFYKFFSRLKRKYTEKRENFKPFCFFGENSLTSAKKAYNQENYSF